MRGQDANALKTLRDHSRVRKGQLIFYFNVWVDELYGRFSLQWGILSFCEPQHVIISTGLPINLILI